MEQRSATAPPVLENIATTTSQRTRDSRSFQDKRLLGIPKRKHHSPDSIEKTAASLFAQVRALIDQPGSTDFANDGNHSTSSNDGDEETPMTSSSGTNRGLGYIEVDTGNFYDIRSSSSSPETKLRIQTVPQHSVTSSIVKSDSPIPAHYLHSSNPTNIYYQHTSKSPPKVATIRSTRSLKGRVQRKPLPGHDPRSSVSDVDNDGEIADGIDPGKIRAQVLSRGPSLTAVVDPIFSVVYDSSGSSRVSEFRTLDLFPRPLILGRKMEKPPQSPANTPATPKPLISVIPPTPMVRSTVSNSPEIARVMRETRVHSSTVLAHTGASTPEESVVRSDDSDFQSSITEHATMIDLGYAENPGGKHNEMRTPPEISTQTTPLEYFPDPPAAEESWKDYVLPGNLLEIKMPGFYTRSQLDELASYTDSESNIPAKNQRTRTLYEEYVLSDPHRDNSTQNRSRSTTLQSKSQLRRQSVSREHEEANKDQDSLITATSSFTRIITDLENMLNQALELAGRAVADSHTALEQRDASIRSVRSLRESILSDGDSILGNAKAESFRTANDQQEAEEITNDRVRSALDILKIPLSRRSTMAVYQDDGKLTSEAENRDQKTQKRERTPHSQGDVRARRKSLPAERPTNERSEEESRSRIPRPTMHSTLNSIRGPGANNTINQDRYLQFSPQNGRPGRPLRIHQPPSGVVFLKKRAKAGWDWSLSRKRYTAGVHCGVVVLIGFIIGCYGGESTALMSSLGITASLTAVGNVLFILGVAIPSLLFWPLPLLHGRKPYVLLAVALTIPLQLPQALSLPPHTLPSQQRSMAPFVICILVFRTISGFVLGFGSMNSLATLVDLFGPDSGACCRGGIVFNSNTPIEGQDRFHLVPGGEAGARIGIWLGVWTWIFFSFGGIGYFVGKLIILRSSPAWGFWIVAIIATVLLLLIWLMPEVRPPWIKQRVITRRRAGWKGNEEKHREDRGEITMVVSGTSPKWWWEEVSAGIVLSWRMCNQLGFLVMATYVGWTAGELTTVFSLLATLESEHYNFTAIDTGLAIIALSVGALLSVPVQLSTFYLRNFRHRVHHRAHSEAQYHYHEGQHPYRTVFFISIFLVPASSLGFTISATGPPVHFVIPVFFAGLTVFSGILAITECHLIVMENFDISNLPEPFLSSGSGSTSYGGSYGGRLHGTQRPSSLVGSNDDFTTCHPAITAAFGIFQFLSLVSIAAAIGWSRRIVSGIGVRYGLGIFTGITSLVTIALLGVLWRWREVRVLEVNADQDSDIGARTTATEVVRVCKVSLLQQGRFTRWSEVNGMTYRGDEEGDVWRLRGRGG